jgi:two-component system, NarL family, sensor histidine kinase UhpB
MSEKLKILILEDSPADAELVKRQLLKDELPCEFYFAVNRVTFVKALDEFMPDLVLSDHSLPQFTSFDALVIARDRFPDIPFIMVTGTVSEEFAAEIMKMGADDYILKDRLTRLPSAINACLQRRRSEKEKQDAEKKIIESENNLRTIFENASEGFLLLDRNGCVKALNNKAAEYPFFVAGKRLEVGDTLYDFIDPGRVPVFKAFIAKVLEGESVHYDIAYDIDKNKKTWIDFSINPAWENERVNGICITGRDITEKKIAEQQKEFDNRNTEALINNTNDLMWSVDRDMNLITSNDAFNKFCEDSFGARIQKGEHILSDTFSKSQLEKYESLYNQAFSGKSFSLIEHLTEPFEFWSEVSFYPIYNGNEVIGTACFSRDITERKKVEQEMLAMEKKILEQKLEQQRKISRAIIKAEEAEKNRIGQELHDNINQILAGTRMFLSMAAKKSPETKALLEYPMELLDSSIQEIRLLSQKQVTPLKDLNLKGMIQNILDDLSKSTKTSSKLDYTADDDSIPDEVKLTLYRIVQEQVNNIYKHADAKNIRIELSTNNNAVTLRITDDGVGFVVNKKRKGIGIANMTDRIASFNGTLEIKSSPGEGCQLLISIPAETAT